MQVMPFENIRENITTKRVMPDKPVMLTSDACDSSAHSALMAVFEIGPHDQELRPYGFMIKLMFDLMATSHDKKDIFWRTDWNITGAFESHFNIGTESQTLTAAQMAQELDNQIQRINFMIQGMNQQAWQDFISYELEKHGND